MRSDRSETLMCATFQKAFGSFARTRLWLIMALSLSTTLVRAAAEPPVANPAPTDESFEALKEEFSAAFRKFAAERRKAVEAELKAAQEAVDAAKTDEEKQTAQKRLSKAQQFPAFGSISPADGPGAAFSPRFLAFAVKNP